MGPEKTEVRYTNGGGDDTKVTFISGSQKYGAGDQDKGEQRYEENRHQSKTDTDTSFPSVQRLQC